MSGHHTLTFHGSAPNGSDQARKTLVLRYIDSACRLLPERLPSPEALVYFPTDAEGHLDKAAFRRSGLRPEPGAAVIGLSSNISMIWNYWKEQGMRVGINGMGRIGRLGIARSLRRGRTAGRRTPRAGNRLEVVHLNELRAAPRPPRTCWPSTACRAAGAQTIAAEGEDARSASPDRRFGVQRHMPAPARSPGVTTAWTWCWNAPASS